MSENREANRILYLSSADIASVEIDISVIIRAVEEAFREKGLGRTEMPPKPGLHPGGEAFIHAMPAYVPSLGMMGIKWISAYPDNPAKGLPYIAGLMILNDPGTGLPLAILDSSRLTALRTAAASAVAARYLARHEATSLGILGAGVQGFSHLEVLITIFPLTTVVVYDTVPEKRDQYATQAAARWPGLKVIQAKSPEEAVTGLDIIVTAGPITRKPHATIRHSWFKEGSFASLVDFDSYWSAEAMKAADKFTTDDIPQLEYYRRQGYCREIPPVYADLGELVTGKKRGREKEEERTLACNLGVAIGDVAAALMIYREALEEGTGTWLPR
jgi:ornithine cyclodeaminase/alanine dehydrogenase